MRTTTFSTQFHRSSAVEGTELYPASPDAEHDADDEDGEIDADDGEGEDEDEPDLEGAIDHGDLQDWERPLSPDSGIF